MPSFCLKEIRANVYRFPPPRSAARSALGHAANGPDPEPTLNPFAAIRQQWRFLPIQSWPPTGLVYRFCARHSSAQILNVIRILTQAPQQTSSIPGGAGVRLTLFSLIVFLYSHIVHDRSRERVEDGHFVQGNAFCYRTWLGAHLISCHLIARPTPPLQGSEIPRTTPRKRGMGSAEASATAPPHRFVPPSRTLYGQLGRIIVPSRCESPLTA